LGDRLSRERPWQELFADAASQPDLLSDALTIAMSDQREIIFAGNDKPSLAVAKDIVSLWSHRLDGLLEAVPIEHITPQGCTDATVVVLATSSPTALTHRLKDLCRLDLQTAWLGAELPTQLGQCFAASNGYFPLSDAWKSCLPEALYFAVNLLLTTALRAHRIERAEELERTLQVAPILIQTVLNDRRLNEQIQQAAAANKGYRSASFLGGYGGTGLAWTARFDRSGALAMESYIYEEGAYGPIVTVDPDAGRKYVALRSRAEMVRAYGEAQVAAWEEHCLDRQEIDDILTAPGVKARHGRYRPFLVDETWYLPVLNPDYPAFQDNLVFVDASLPRHIPRAMDTLSVYGARFARIVLIVQQAGKHRDVPSRLFQYPLCQVLELPRMSLDGRDFSIPELLLPVAMNLVATRISATGLWTGS
jgi:hypothetical protein